MGQIRGFFHLGFSTFEKSIGFFPFGANLTHFRPKSDRVQDGEGGETPVCLPDYLIAHTPFRLIVCNIDQFDEEISGNRLCQVPVSRLSGTLNIGRKYVIA